MMPRDRCCPWLPSDSAEECGFALGTELLRDLRQQQPGASNAASESHDYGQDHDIETGVDSKDQEQAGDQEQHRRDGVGR
jgi:hypothetical protein